jgi:RNA polymerase sigma factor (sigma-70 family)
MTDEKLTALAAALARRYRAPGLGPADLAQEAALAALEALRDCPHAGGRPRRLFVLGRVRCHLHNAASRGGVGKGEWRRSNPDLDLWPDLWGVPSPDPDPHDAAALSELLDAAADLLAPREVQVLALTFAHGHPPSDIADALDLPPGAVRKALSIALKKLRRDPEFRKKFRPHGNEIESS